MQRVRQNAKYTGVDINVRRSEVNGLTDDTLQRVVQDAKACYNVNECRVPLDRL